MNPSYELMDRAREEYARKGVLRQEFHKGYEAGKRARTPEQWQLDMERMEVARRVDAVTLDNGSYVNLSAIASAIYEPEFGWTSGACAMLRDKLVRLLGGAHERDCRGGRDDTGASRADSSDREQAEEVMQSELVNCGNPYKAGGAVLDSGVIAQYEVLGNERHKAICELRKLPDWYAHDGKGSPAGKFNDALSDAIGVMGLTSFAKIRDRLIYLLGGDEPTLSDLWGVWKDADWTRPNDDGTCPDDGPTSPITDERHKAVCELRKIHADAGGFVKALANALGVEWQAPRVRQTLASVRDRLIYLLGGNEPNFTETAETINLGDESDGNLMENGENHKMATITDELREFKGHINAGLTPEMVLALRAEINCIADRIDARHRLTSIVAEASTSDEWTAMSEYDKVRRQRDELRAELEELRGQSRTCPESDEEVSESAPSVSITDELRAYSRDSVKRDDYMGGLTFDLDRIAGRIDEQFNRICEQHEAVLQSTIDDMCDELDGLEENNAELTANNDELTAKCGELQERVLQSTIEQMADENLTVKDERDYWKREAVELQAKLDKIAVVLDGRD